MIRLKRVYEPASPEDGWRVLVERLWPRGVSKEKAALDSWCKEVAPSPELRIWFSHDPGKWDEFRTKYDRELDANLQIVKILAGKSARGTITFVYSSRDSEHNNAMALREYIEKHNHGKKGIFT